MRKVKLIFLVLQNGKIMKNKWIGRLMKYFFVSISVSLALMVILFVMVFTSEIGMAEMGYVPT